MGKVSSTHGDAPDILQTRCTTCRTVFEVSPEMLSSSDTRVRCGECLSIFDALENLVDGATDGERSPGSGRDHGAAAAPTDGSATGDPRASDEDDAPDGATAERAVGTAGAAEAPGEAEAPDEAEAPGEAATTGAARAAGDAEAEAFGESADDTGVLDVTYADFDLFSGDARLPEIAYLDGAAETADFDLDSAGPDRDDVPGDETLGDAPFTGDETAESSSPVDDATADGTVAVAQDDEEPAFVEDDGTVEPPVFRYRDPDGSGAEDRAASRGPDPAALVRIADGDPAIPVPGAAAAPLAPPALVGASAGGGSWRLRALMALTLAALLAGLYVYRERHVLHNDALVRPFLLGGCRIIGCEVLSRVDIDALQLLGKQVFTHPSEDGALVINLAFRNTATFDQRYPVLVVRLRDRVGQQVTELDFQPADYLDSWRAGDTLAAGQRLDISLKVGDPGEEADSYEFEFREAAG